MIPPRSPLAESIRARIRNKARELGRPIAELLQRFCMERFLWRLSISRHRSRFVLKGAMMMTTWRDSLSRPTLDIDLLDQHHDDLASLLGAIREIGRVESEPPDGLRFVTTSMESEPFAFGGEPCGARIRFAAQLGETRIRMQLDVSFEDANPRIDDSVTLPALLEFPPAHIQGYTRETAVAEKLHAMHRHGALNSRMKDFHDIGVLARRFDFEGQTLAEAIRATFAHRQTEASGLPAGLSDAFAEEPGKQRLWEGFLDKISDDDSPRLLAVQVRSLRDFLAPPLQAVAADVAFGRHWRPGGPWQ